MSSDIGAELRLMEYAERIKQLEDEVKSCKAENARLQEENAALHETAWEMIRKVRLLQNSKDAIL